MQSVPKGFRIGTAAAGFRRPDRDDLGLIFSEVPAAAAGVFTTNVFKAAPVLVAQSVLEHGNPVRGIVVNSGQANACTGDEGIENCCVALSMVGQALNIPATSFIPLSTGVIGTQLKMDLWAQAVPALVASLGAKSGEDFTRAMMTTDAFPKFIPLTLELAGGTVRLLGMAKGAGMICPNMATMLSVILCDAQIEATAWSKMFPLAVENTFNRVSVDGDTSTNDTVIGLANGASGVTVAPHEEARLAEAVEKVLGQLAYMLVQDGEGATKVMHICVRGASSVEDAEQIARTVGHSQLVKTAMYGRDANWGRIVAAAGRSGVLFNGDDLRLWLCGVEVFSKGQPTSPHMDKELEAPLKERDIRIDIDLGAGSAEYTLLASDLSHDYVSCNADYRS